MLFLCLALPAFGEEDENDDEEVAAKKLAARIDVLEKEVGELKAAQSKWKDWNVTISGEYRARALIEANTRNNFTNKAGEVLYAYEGDSTTSNDYGWWDYRGQLKLDVEWKDLTRLGVFLQIGNSAWGNQAPIFGGDSDRSFGNTDLVFRELYVDVSLVFIPVRLQFGRFDFHLGNRLIWGLENDGLNLYLDTKYVRAGFMGIRQYEGERYEFSIRNNDDEDTFIAYVNTQFNPVHYLSVYGYLTLYEIPKYGGNEPDIRSPLRLIPGWSHEDYDTQGNNLYTVGANYVADFEKLKLNLEADVQFGTIYPSSGLPASREIHFNGYAALAKLDFRPNPTDVLALTMGWGSGDDPDTQDYEGFFAPDNDFGIEEDYSAEYIERGYFMVYEHLSPGAGVPGGMFDGYGTGGIENTIFALLGYDANFQANHHYYVGVGAIWSAEPNPETDSNIIGVEVDVSIDYMFSEHVWFRVYGGHLFVMGDYFRKDAYDAASIDFEWKVLW